MPTHTWEVKYFAKRLAENVDDAKPILTKLYAHEPISIEETYLVRRVLEQQASIVRLFNEHIAEPDPIPVPRWKKLFRK